MSSIVSKHFYLGYNLKKKKIENRAQPTYFSAIDKFKFEIVVELYDFQGFLGEQKIHKCTINVSMTIVIFKLFIFYLIKLILPTFPMNELRCPQ